MSRRLLLPLSAAVLATLSFFAFAGAARAENSTIYVQGRGWGSWDAEVVTGAAGWTSRTLAFNGNAPLNSNETNVVVKNAISTYCGGANNCVIVCYSAGCGRVLKAVDDLRAAGNTLPGLFWIEAAGSAAGGTKLAEVATQGFTSFLAKLLGQQEKIDADITPGAARGTWGYTQDSVPPDAMYQVAGNRDICKSFLFFKICGNSYVDAGVADGLVGLDSAAGASSQGRYTNGCTVAKYPGRYWEPGIACGGEPRDHSGLPGRTVALLAPQISGVATDKLLKWGDDTNDPDCSTSPGKCDNAASNPATDFSKTPSLAFIATDVSPFSSPTTGNTLGATCGGKCGRSSGSCWCDGSCTARGDCCADYTAMKCDVVNAQ